MIASDDKARLARLIATAQAKTATAADAEAAARAAAVDLYTSGTGATIAEIAEMLGLTKQRFSQIVQQSKNAA